MLGRFVKCSKTWVWDWAWSRGYRLDQSVSLCFCFSCSGQTDVGWRKRSSHPSLNCRKTRSTNSDGGRGSCCGCCSVVDCLQTGGQCGACCHVKIQKQLTAFTENTPRQSGWWRLWEFKGAERDTHSHTHTVRGWVKYQVHTCFSPLRIIKLQPKPWIYHSPSHPNLTPSLLTHT